MDGMNLEVAWEVEEPSLGFAERVVVTATGEGFEALDRASGMVPRFLRRGPPSGIRALRRTIATGVVAAAAAAVLCLFGASTGQRSGRTSAAELQEELSRYGYPESLVDLRTSASGGNTAENPEAGATGLW
jgi:hypothetical protein